MTLDELSDNFAAHADAIYQATAAGVGLTYSGQPVIRDTVRDVMTQLAGPQFGRNWGGLEKSAKLAIEEVLNPGAKKAPEPAESVTKPAGKAKPKK